MNHGKIPLKIEIHSYDRRLAYSLFGSPLKRGDSIEVREGIEAVFQHTEGRRSLGWPEIVAFAVTVSVNIPPTVAANLITQWLMSKVTKKPEKIVVERTEVEFEEGAIRRIIHEKISWGL